MSSYEYGLWREYHRHEPLDDGWRQMGMLMALMANLHREKSKDPYRYEDFMPSPWSEKEPEPEMSPADFIRMHYGG